MIPIEQVLAMCTIKGHDMRKLKSYLFRCAICNGEVSVLRNRYINAAPSYVTCDAIPDVYAYPKTYIGLLKHLDLLNGPAHYEY